MKFDYDGKRRVKPLLVDRNKEVGEINVLDGLIDVTDPCYDETTWCARFGLKIKAGKYKCYVTVVNYRDRYEYEARDFFNDRADGLKPQKIGKHYTLDDMRIVELIMVHENYLSVLEKPGWRQISSNIGVDAGLCGFYNHKPDFEEDDVWLDFCNNLKEYSETCHSVCDVKDYGITVSSGFGDGCYGLYAIKHDTDKIALRLKFY